MKQTTIPVAADDISERTQDTWEELIVDAYNCTARGTRTHSIESFSTLPLVSANWRFTAIKSRAFTRCITIPFVEHQDEPDATHLFANLQRARDTAAAAAGDIIESCASFSNSEAEDAIDNDIFPNISSIFRHSHPRFKSTMTIFMHFYLKVPHHYVYSFACVAKAMQAFNDEDAIKVHVCCCNPLFL